MRCVDFHQTRILQCGFARQGDGKHGQAVDPDRIMVRARVRGHLEALKKRFPGLLGECEIQESLGTDYAYRLFVQKSAWASVLAGLAEETDYDNFKSEVDGTREGWSALRTFAARGLVRDAAVAEVKRVYGTVEIQFQHMKKPPLGEEAKRKGLLQRLSAIGLPIPQDALSRRPGFGLSLLKEPATLARFLEAFDWVLSEIKDFEHVGSEGDTVEAERTVAGA